MEIWKRLVKVSIGREQNDVGPAYEDVTGPRNAQGLYRARNIAGPSEGHRHVAQLSAQTTPCLTVSEKLPMAMRKRRSDPIKLIYS